MGKDKEPIKQDPKEQRPIPQKPEKTPLDQLKEDTEKDSKILIIEENDKK